MASFDARFPADWEFDPYKENPETYNKEEEDIIGKLLRGEALNEPELKTAFSPVSNVRPAEVEKPNTSKWQPQQGRQYNIEDRRNEGPPSLDTARLFDPTLMEKSLSPQYLGPGEYYNKYTPIPSGPPTALARDLGAEDLQKALDINKLMGLVGLR